MRWIRGVAGILMLSFFVTLYGGRRFDRPDFGLEKTVEKEDAG